MWGRRKRGWLAVCATVLVCAGAAGAAGSGGRMPAVSLNVTGPAAFPESCCTSIGGGSWLGPEYTNADGTPSGVRARLDWSIRLDVRASAADVAVRKGLVRGWPVVEAGAVFVPHVVRGRRIGTIPASYLLSQRPGGAQTELSVALALHRGVFARAHFVLGGNPTGTRTATSTFSVDGVQAADWNRQTIWSTLSGLVLEGSLPPATIMLHRTRRGFAGTVRDVNGDPVAGAKVTLLRREGSRWKAAGVSRTRAQGGYTVVQRLAPGSYRATTSVAGYEARSPARKA